MTRPSPYDLIQKASRAGAADRWAALQAYTQSRDAVPQQGEPPSPAAQGAAETNRPCAPDFIRPQGGNCMNILVINAGSSSLKYQLIDMDNEKLLA